MGKWTRFTRYMQKAALAAVLMAVMVVALATLVFSGPAAYACPMSGHSAGSDSAVPAQE